MEKRPGTINYSKWDDFKDSDDETNEKKLPSSESESESESESAECESAEYESRIKFCIEQEHQRQRQQQRQQEQNENRRQAVQSNAEAIDDKDSDDNDYYSCNSDSYFDSSGEDSPNNDDAHIALNELCEKYGIDYSDDDSSDGDCRDSGDDNCHDIDEDVDVHSDYDSSDEDCHDSDEDCYDSDEDCYDSDEDCYERDNDGKKEEESSNTCNQDGINDQNMRHLTKERTCSSCNAVGNSMKVCSRCKMACYCNITCQRNHFPIHKLECISKNEHMMYWGMLSKNTSSLSKSDLIAARENALRARMKAKRQRASKLEAAAVAIERAQRRRDEVQKEAGCGGKGGKNIESREELCSICQCEFTVSGDVGAGLKCPSSHHMCHECSGIFVESVMSETAISYPPKCPLCKGCMPKDQFDAQLTTEQQVCVRTLEAERALQPNQMLTKCPQCDHFWISTKPGQGIWFCNQCSIVTCFICNKTVCQGEESDHDACIKYRFIKEKIENAFQNGAVMPCPQCNLSGRKDDACTHMDCVRCGCKWCYVCGLSVEDCDKDSPREGSEVNDIYLHNRDWEMNSNRCPMYLTQILEVDLNWLGENWEEHATNEDFEDDEKCLDHFHRFRTIKMLQEVRNEVGDVQFDETFEHFDSLKNSGYAIDEIISTDTATLIDREEYMHYGMEEGDEDGQHDSEGDNNDRSEDEDDGEERVGDALTAALEEQQMRLAVVASHASALEDEELRIAIEESSYQNH